MTERDEFEILRGRTLPAPASDARQRALQAAMSAFEENSSAAPQGPVAASRLTDRAKQLWSGIMGRRLIGAPALAGMVALPLAAYATFHAMQRERPFAIDGVPLSIEAGEAPRVEAAPAAADKPAVANVDGEEDRDLGQTLAEAPPPLPVAPAEPAASVMSREIAPDRARGPAGAAAPKRMAPESFASDMIAPDAMVTEESRDRLQEFQTNPVKSALESPVSTFSVDVDTASYAYVRSALKNGMMPTPETVRVEEMVNYFPYGWKGPESAATPFNATVSVMPTPWNAQTRLMHVAIKGFDVQPAARPRANLVFLIDTSGSMNDESKLPLLKNAFRLLVDRMGPDDTVSIVAYAGGAGTVLEPTGDKGRILDALDRLEAGGTTAGEAGIREAYRLAERSFVKDGVNRVMLATDGDFNVGQTDDDDLKRLVEEKRRSGVFLSVLGFGRGNYNDQMMQVLAQNGNGAAAYIDTLAEAEKTMVQEASSTLFAIAKDVKLQVEFNPAVVAEYRLIGYETRTLARQDFNDDRVDAGDIGSGHSVTAIYEVTPKGSPAQAMDDLRYGQARVNNPDGIANPSEYAFVKIRYKLPGEDVSKLITTPVTSANEVPEFAAASDDLRFSVAVAAFGQKLRGTSQTAGLGYDRIIEIASAARGADPFGYRAEFLSLVRLASVLDKTRR